MPTTYREPINPHSSPTVQKIKLQLTITYSTSGLVRYIDENNCPKIIEFYGKKWEKELDTSGENANNFKVFVNNSFLRINECLTLTSIVDDIVQCRQEFLISGKDLFEGWFSLEN